MADIASIEKELAATRAELTSAQAVLSKTNDNLRTAQAAYDAAQIALDDAQSAFQNGKITQAQLDAAIQKETALFNALESAKNERSQASQVEARLSLAVDKLEKQLETAKASASTVQNTTPPVNGTVQANSTGTVTTTNSSGVRTTTNVAPRSASTTTNIINTGTSAAATAEKYADPQNIDIKVDEITTDEISNVSFPDESPDNAASAVPPNPVPAFARFKNADRRVRLIVPESYLSGPAAGPPAGNTNRGVLSLNGGIVFPYTPSISYEQSANYNTVNAMHSNFTQYFYKNSGVGEISLTAKFTVQNSFEAATLLAVQHLCRALVKMPFGDDANAGSPPPVCRLMAYGDYQLEGTPVAIKSYKMDLPDTVDYFVVDKKYGYGTTSVPISTVITLMLVPLYSRQEQLQFSVEKWLTGNQRIQGYL
jgi:hypothetical protein